MGTTVFMPVLGLVLISAVRFAWKMMKTEHWGFCKSSLSITPAWEQQETQRRFQEQARQAHDLAVRMHQEAHDTAMQMHQEANDTAVQMHEQAHMAACNPFFM